MAVISDGTAWVATSGGVMQWDLAGGSSRMHTRKTGLPTIDIASVVLDSSHTVWAIGTDGRIGYLTAGATEWRTIESYSNQNWTFTKRAALFWKGPNHPGFLVLGTDHGLSLFSLKTMAAEDYASSFGRASGTVHSIMVTPGSVKAGGGANSDTLWVALDAGLVHATPDWDNVGTAGHYLADPTQWKVDTLPVDSTKPYWTLIRGANGIRLGNDTAEWSNASGSLSIQSGTVLNKSWQKGVPMAGAVHATSYGQDLLVSTSTQGAVLLSSSGNVKAAAPEGNYPDIPPQNLRIAKDGSLVALTQNRVLIHSATKNWEADTVRYKTTDGQDIVANWDYNETNWRHRLGLAFGPGGEILVATFTQWASYAGIYTSLQKGSWNHFGYSSQDTCNGYPLENVAPSIGSSAILAGHAGPTGTWFSALNHTYSGRVLFMASGGQTPPTCLDVPAETNGGVQNELNDLLQVGDTLWIASKTSLVRVPSPRPAYPPPMVTNASFLKPSFAVNLNLTRLAVTTFEDKSWIVGTTDGRLILYPTDGIWGGRQRNALITSDSTAPSLNQKYVAVNVDAQGQVWAAGEKGIDIIRLTSPEADTLPPGFQLVRRITTADGLPENSIIDMDLQVSTGKALIATPLSVSLWTSPYRPIAARLAKSSIRVSPNPVRLRRAGEPDKYLYVDGATADSRFDLLGADGTLVMHLDASKMVGGQFQIPLPAPSKLRPGLYFWSLKDKNGSVRGPLLIAE